MTMIFDLRVSLVAATSVFCLSIFLHGCAWQTMDVTTMEQNRAAYRDARDFLRVGEVTQEQTVVKYGAPKEKRAMENGERWRYEHNEAVLVNAYTGTSFGTDGALMAGSSGFRQTVSRRTRMDLFFNTNGVLVYYRIMRDAPPGEQ